MASTSYRIVVKNAEGIVITIARYKSKEKLEVGEELILYYKDESHLVKITAVNKDYSADAKEI
jgi:hypothetical protein